MNGKRCIAFVPSKDFAELWLPCTKPRDTLCQSNMPKETGLLFCRDHALARKGILLGILSYRKEISGT